MGRRGFWHTKDRPEWVFFRDLTRILSMKINGNIPFKCTFYLLISLSQLHSKWSDLWRWHLFFFIFFYFTDILTQFNRISPSCVTKRYHFMDVKRIFVWKKFQVLFFLSNVNLSDYNKICKLINYCVPRGPPSLPFFFWISSLAYILSKVYIFKKYQPSSSEKKYPYQCWKDWS